MRYLIYLIPIAVFGYLLWSRRARSTLDVKAMLTRGAQIVDVRTKAEFSSNADPRAINLPLDQLGSRIKELDRNRPVLVCCETGTRSVVGVSILKRAGFTDVANLGSWRRIHILLS